LKVRKPVAKSLLKQAVKNTFFISLGTLASFIIGLLFAGLRIRYLGVEKAGYVMLLESILSISSVVGGFGFGTAALRKVAILSSRGEYSEVVTTVGSLLFVNLLTGAVVFAGVFLFGFDAIYSWSGTSPQFRTDGYYATLALGFSFLVNQLVSAYEVNYTALQRFDVRSYVGSFFSFSNGAIGLAVVLARPTMTAVCTASASVLVVRLAVSIVITRRLIHGLALPRFEWQNLKSMMGFGGWAYATSLSKLLKDGLDKIILTSVLGSSSLPYYVIGQKVVSQVHGFIGGQSEFLFPMLSAEAEQSEDVINRVNDRLRWFIAFVSAIAYSGIAAFAYPILAKLVGVEFALIAYIPFLIACIQGFLFAQAIVPYHVSWARGQGVPNALYEFGTGILVVVATVILAPKLGVVGVSLSQLACGITGFLLIYWVLRENVSNSWKKLLRPYLTPLVVVFCVFGANVVLVNFAHMSLKLSFYYVLGLLVLSGVISVVIESYYFAECRTVKTLMVALRHLISRLPGRLVRV
jgi:O-antigen/teichoic acid export membrane protein